MKHLYIHIGTHRTGTTSLQACCFDFQRLFERENIKYDDLSYELGRDLLLYNKPIPAEEPLGLTTGILYKKSLRKETFDKVLWSSEGFFGNPFLGYSNIGYIADYLKYITEGIDTTIIVFIRERSDFIRSLFHLYKRSGNSLGYDDFVKNMNKFKFNWDRLVGKYEDRFDNVLVYRYEGTDVINTIFDIISFPMRCNSNNYKYNKSIEKHISIYA